MRSTTGTRVGAPLRQETVELIGKHLADENLRADPSSGNPEVHGESWCRERDCQCGRREVLRLRLAQRLSQRAVAESLQLSAGPVTGYLAQAGGNWLARCRRVISTTLGWRISGRCDGASGAAAGEHDAAFVMGGVPVGGSGRIRLFLVLRSPPHLD